MYLSDAYMLLEGCIDWAYDETISMHCMTVYIMYMHVHVLCKHMLKLFIHFVESVVYEDRFYIVTPIDIILAQVS